MRRERKTRVKVDSKVLAGASGRMELEFTEMGTAR